MFTTASCTSPPTVRQKRHQAKARRSIASRLERLGFQAPVEGVTKILATAAFPVRHRSATHELHIRQIRHGPFLGLLHRAHLSNGRIHENSLLLMFDTPMSIAPCHSIEQQKLQTNTRGIREKVMNKQPEKVCLVRSSCSYLAPDFTSSMSKTFKNKVFS